jgi:hypothetical protein
LIVSLKLDPNATTFVNFALDGISGNQWLTEQFFDWLTEQFLIG